MHTEHELDAILDAALAKGRVLDYGTPVEQPDKPPLGDRLRYYRQRAKLSSTAAGVLAGYAQSSIIQMEKGKSTPSPEGLVRLAAAYKCTVSELTGDDPVCAAALELQGDPVVTAALLELTLRAVYDELHTLRARVAQLEGAALPIVDAPGTATATAYSAPAESAAAAVDRLTLRYGRVSCEDGEDRDLELEAECIRRGYDGSPGGVWTCDDPAELVERLGVTTTGVCAPDCNPEWRYRVGHALYRVALKRRGTDYAVRYFGRFELPPVYPGGIRTAEPKRGYIKNSTLRKYESAAEFREGRA